MQYSESDLLDLIGLIYQTAADGDAGWDALLSRFGEIGDGMKTFFLVQDSFTSAPNGLLAHNFDPSWLEKFEAHYASVNPTPVDQFSVGQVLTSQMMIDRAKMERSEFYSDWLRPQEDLIGSAALTVRKSAGQVFVVGCSIRRQDVDSKEAAAARLLTLLRPHLMRALDIQRMLFEQRAALSAGLRGGGRAAAILAAGPEGELLHTSDAALEMLREGHVIRQDARGRFRFSASASQREYEAACSGLPLLPGRRLKQFETPPSAAGGPKYRCTVLPLELHHGLPGFLPVAGSRGVSVVTLERLAASDNPEAALRARFGFTRKEALTALALANGDAPQAIAEHFSVSVVTVRNQLKSAMSKAGVHRQAELVREVLLAAPEG